MLFAARSHIGLVRQMNQDSFGLLQGTKDPWQLTVIADGMGGASAGEVASKLATETVLNLLSNKVKQPDINPEQELLTAVQEANQKIWLTAQSAEIYAGMGTTLVAALTSPSIVAIVHIGDSRAYLLSEGVLQQVTQDHSLVGELVRRGQLSEEEALTHPQRNIVTRSLGTASDSEPEYHSFAWGIGDILLLCTDGLSNLLRSHELRDLLQPLVGAHSDTEVEECAQRLVGLALERGAPDNITLALVVHQEGTVSE
ncbi:Stp1/IreP family PP2C-type Ser/Thr phosphatase [Alicyclobacillaceae bacterium I2511]|nr:Stp1/IreP family PP2C-type Ser/Thr phosphatase [Alicyclobacillaceae bacterium I2511]